MFLVLFKLTMRYCKLQLTFNCIYILKLIEDNCLALIFFSPFHVNIDITLTNQVLYHSKAQVWSSTRALVSGLGGWDGLTVPPKALKHHTQILANLHCNDHMAFNDGTCCSSPERTTIIQRLAYSAVAVW